MLRTVGVLGAVAGLTISAQGSGAGEAAPTPVATQTDEVRAIVAEMLADAATRSSLLDEEPASNYAADRGFHLASADGDFLLKIRGWAQFRYVATLRNSDPVVAPDDFESGFQTSRTKLTFFGHVFEPALFYQVQGNFSPSTGTHVLEDAFFGYRFDNGVALRVGQGISYFMREWHQGDLKTLSADRSVLAFQFGQARSQFIELTYRNKDFRAVGTYSDGFRSQNSDLGASPAEWALTGRFDVRLAGSLADFESEYESPPGSAFGAVVGGAMHYERAPDPNVPGTAEQSLFAWTADLVLKGDGWHVATAGVGYHVTDEAGVPNADFEDFGWQAQTGVFLADDVEVFGRYDVIVPDDARPANATFNMVTAGLNWFVHGHAAKFTLQAAYTPDAVNDTTAGNFGGAGARTPANTLLGLLPAADEGQLILTAQFQVIF